MEKIGNPEPAQAPVGETAGAANADMSIAAAQLLRPAEPPSAAIGAAACGPGPADADVQGMGVGDTEIRPGLGFVSAASQRDASTDDEPRCAGIGFVASAEQSAQREPNMGMARGVAFVAASTQGDAPAAEGERSRPIAFTPSSTPVTASEVGADTNGTVGHGSPGDAAESGAQADLSPAEIERRKILEFEEKLKRVSSQAESLGCSRPGVGGADADGVDPLSVFVGGLDYMVTPAELQDSFKACGAISRVTVLVDPLTGQSRGAAYIEFQDAGGVQNALLLNGSTVHGQQVKVLQKKATKAKGKGKDKGKDKWKGEAVGANGDSAAGKGKEWHPMKGKGKDFDYTKGKGKDWDYTKGKGKDWDGFKGKGKHKGKLTGNIVYYPNRAQPYG